MHNRILLYMLAAFLCFDPAASFALAASSTAAIGTQRPAPLPLSKSEAQAPRQAQQQTQDKARKKQGISGFSSNPFELKHRAAPAQTASHPRVSYGAHGRRQAQKAPPRLQLSGRVDSVPEDRLVPHRMALPGGPQTLSAIEHDPAPEVSMSYRLDQHTTTKVTINPQDTSSPLYRPVENAGTVNSAGVYMNMDVKPDLQLQIGGEYCDVETRGGATSGDSTSRGASVGLRWTF